MAVLHCNGGSSDSSGGSSPSLIDQATAILDAATTLQQRLAALSLPQPTDLPGGRRDWHDASAHPDVLRARSALVDASSAMFRLALGPTDYLASLAGPGVAQLEVLRTLDALGVAQAVPLSPPVPVVEANDDSAKGRGEVGGRGENAGGAMIALPTLAADLGVDEARLARQLRFAYLVGVFREPRPGFVAHTAASAVLPAAAPWLRVRTSSALTRGVDRLPEVLRGGGREEGQDQGQKTQDEVLSSPVEKTATQLADPKGRALWAILEEDYQPPGEGMRLFSAGMKAMMAGLLGDDLLPYAHGFDWASLCRDDAAATGEPGVGKRATVVDVGGGNGHVEVALLPRVPPGIDFVVQDLPANEASACALLAQHQHEDGKSSRITFQAHDFFQPQPAVLPGTTAAAPSVYLLSRVLHDWRDDECVAILRHLVPGMEHHGARLWLCERVLPEAGAEAAAGREEDGGDVKGDGRLPNHVEQQLRAPDLLMLTLFGGGERTMADWTRVLARTDARLRVRACRQPLDSVFSFMEVVLDDVEG